MGDEFQYNSVEIDLIETERERISKELHDTSIQDLVHVIHQTEIVSHYLGQDQEKAKEELAKLRQNLKNIVHDMRDLIFNIRPAFLDDLPFGDILSEYFSYLQSISDIQFSYTMEDGLEHLSREKQILLFRALQEASNNTVRHSKAKHCQVEIVISKSRYYKCTICDDGKGCEKSEMNKIRHFGIQIMYDRIRKMNGIFFIDTAPGAGFKIEILIPMDA